MHRMRAPVSYHSWRRVTRRGIACFLSLLLIPATLLTRATAQPLRPEPVFGIGDNEFLIGGWNLPLADTGSFAGRADRAIAWARDMGVSVFRLASDYEWSLTDHYASVDALLNAADATSDIRFFLVPANVPGSSPAYGLEAKFYLVPDSVPFKDWPCKFLFLASGQTDSNTVEKDDWNQGAKERVYHRSLVPVNTRIADSIVIDWRPE